MLYQQIQANKRKTFLLVALFIGLVLAMGWAIGYFVNQSSMIGIVITVLILAIYIPLTYRTASSQVLRMTGAREIARHEHPRLFAIVEEISIAARVPMPKVYIVDDPAPNAFATGIKPEKGSVAFTTGLLERLNREELEGVVAHEIAHIRNYDIRLMTICIALVGVVALIGNYGMRLLFYRGRGRSQSQRGGQKSHPALVIISFLFIILAPLAAQFVQLAVSRNREYLADASAVEFTRNPVGLINALKKISSDPNEIENAQKATAALYISNPFKKKGNSLKQLSSTHPSMESRIDRLQRM